MLSPDIVLKAKQEAAYMMQCDINSIKFSDPEPIDDSKIVYRMTANIMNQSMIYHLSPTHFRKLYHIKVERNAQKTMIASQGN